MSAPVPDPNKEYLPEMDPMGGTIWLPLGAGHYTVQRSITIAQNLSFWP